MARDVLIFANPIAGRGKGKAVAERLYHALARRGRRVTLFLSREESAHWDGSHQDVEAAIVIGGDGTLRSVAQWAIDAAPLPGSANAIPYPLLVVPMGTANLMGKHLGLTWRGSDLADQVCAALDSRRIVELDVARTRDGIFLLMAGIGFDAWVVHELARIRSGPIDLTKYVMPTMKAVTEYRFPSITVSIDGRHVFGPSPALAAVGNVKEYGAGFPLLPDARPDDQLLDVCVMPCASWKDLFKLALLAATGEHVRHEGVIYTKGRSIHIDSPAPLPVQVDGEAAGTTPVDIDLLPGRIPFIVPSRAT